MKKKRNDVEVLSTKAESTAIEAAVKTLTDAGLLHWSPGIDECEFLATLNIAVDEGEDENDNWIPYLRFDERLPDEEVASRIYPINQTLWNNVQRLAHKAAA